MNKSFVLLNVNRNIGINMEISNLIRIVTCALCHKTLTLPPKYTSILRAWAQTNKTHLSSSALLLVAIYIYIL